MGTSKYAETGNVHLNMDLQDTLPYHEVVAALVTKYATTSSKILDIGCGLGHIEGEIKSINPDLKIDIADAYDKCLEFTASRGNVDKQFSIDEVIFNIDDVVDQTYDVIVMSHVLEHLVFPAKALDDVMKKLNPDGILIVAVPNPVRPSVFITNLFKSHYVNRGHVHSWDRSHWRNFLEVIMGYNVLEYKTDYIQLPRATRSNIMRKIGKLLVKGAPWWGFSNIAVVKNSANDDSIYKAWKQRQESTASELVS